MHGPISALVMTFPSTVVWLFVLIIGRPVRIILKTSQGSTRYDWAAKLNHFAVDLRCHQGTRALPLDYIDYNETHLSINIEYFMLIKNGSVTMEIGYKIYMCSTQ